MAKNAAKLVNASKIPELFPPVQFAFYGNTITRYRQKILKKKVVSSYMLISFLIGQSKIRHNICRGGCEGIPLAKCGNEQEALYDDEQGDKEFLRQLLPHQGS